MFAKIADAAYGLKALAARAYVLDRALGTHLNQTLALALTLGLGLSVALMPPKTQYVLGS